MKVTKQGVRDLGGNSRIRREQVVVGCPHVWERAQGWDCYEDKSLLVSTMWYVPRAERAK